MKKKLIISLIGVVMLSTSLISCDKDVKYNDINNIQQTATITKSNINGIEISVNSILTGASPYSNEPIFIINYEVKNNSENIISFDTNFIEVLKLNFVDKRKSIYLSEIPINTNILQLNKYKEIKQGESVVVQKYYSLPIKYREKSYHNWVDIYFFDCNLDIKISSLDGMDFILKKFKRGYGDNFFKEV